MKPTKKVKLLLAALLAIGGILVGASSLTGSTSAAKEPQKPGLGLRVSPVSQNIELKPGTKKTGSMRVSNISKNQMEFEVYAAP
jgi:hypothetical protein